MSTVGVVVIVAGRRRHLGHLLDGLTRQSRTADELVVVRMDRVAVPAGARRAAERVSVVDVPMGGPLPLAAARNAGALALRTDTVLFLDVDCIPGAGLVAGLASATEQTAGLVCGSLRYLEPGAPGRTWTEEALVAASHPHAARPQVAPGDLVRADRYELAWTTCLAMRAETFRQVGGFDERFTGYGAEDTDFGVRAAALETGVWWSGDMVAYHQHHGDGDPGEHLADIVRNARLFADVHGWFPMQGWLEDFRARGLIDFDPDAGRLALREGAAR